MAIGTSSSCLVLSLEDGVLTQQGNDIAPDTAVNTTDLEGFYVSLSGDATRVAALEVYPMDSNTASRLRVFELDGDDWVQLGSTIVAPSGNQFGKSISLSNDGSTLACGTSSETQGDSVSVTVYEYSGSTWSPLGSDLETETVSFWSLKVVSLSDDGETLAIGGSRFLDSETRVYTYDGSSWAQLGNDMTPDALLVQLDGYFVTLSGDGSTCAIMSSDVVDGSPLILINVYTINNLLWALKGTQFEVNGQPFSFFQTVALSDDGDSICFGEVDSNNAYNGRFFDYDSDSATWVQKGSDLVGLAEDAVPVVISGNGQTVGLQDSDNTIVFYNYSDPSPSAFPSISMMPSLIPSDQPSSPPTSAPTRSSSSSPTSSPSSSPSVSPIPSLVPSTAPSRGPGPIDRFIEATMVNVNVFVVIFVIVLYRSITWWFEWTPVWFEWWFDLFTRTQS